MKKLIKAFCIGVLGVALAPGVQAGVGPSPDEFFLCSLGNLHPSGYFCNEGTLYEVNVNCSNLEGLFFGSLGVSTEAYGGSGFWQFDVDQNVVFGDPVEKEAVCRASGIYGDRLKTEMKCTDALKGSNKPGKKHVDGLLPQADFEIKFVEEDSLVCATE